MVDCNNNSLKVEIDYLKKDVSELKKDQKEDRRLLTSAIDTLKEGQIRQTAIMEQLAKRDKDLSDNIKKIGSDVEGLKKGTVINSISDNKIINLLIDYLGKIIIVMLIVFLTMYGLDASKIISIP